MLRNPPRLATIVATTGPSRSLGSKSPSVERSGCCYGNVTKLAPYAAGLFRMIYKSGVSQYFAVDGAVPNLCCDWNRAKRCRHLKSIERLCFLCSVPPMSPQYSSRLGSVTKFDTEKASETFTGDTNSSNGEILPVSGAVCAPLSRNLKEWAQNCISEVTIGDAR